MTTGTPPPTAPTTTRKRSRVRTYLPLAIAAWLVLEIWLLTLVAGAAGGLTVFLLLVGGVVLGGAVIKRAGRRAFKNLSETLQRQQQSGGAYDPQAEQGRKGSGNGFVMLAGLLLILPGLISDALGLLLLLPPVRKALGRYAEKSLQRRMNAVQQPGSLGDMFQQARMHQPDGKVVQGEVIRDDTPGGSHPYPPRHDDGPRTPLTP
ncbi:FxsA family membrane protein [Streptomyces sp. NPDC051561]|uniref:FxsA family membrane protein n=1 Tax=Streptomyces sp. NPDC051561 TaxID=3365658 RepID=UPI003792A75B